MNIIANTFFLRNLKNLNFFTLDLGKTRKNVNNRDGGKTSFRKLTEIELKYDQLYHRTLLVYGTIGKVTFYEDLRLDGNRFLVFNNDDIYEIEYEKDELIDFENYILGVMRKIDEIDKPSDEIHNIDEYENAWTPPTSDEKNKGKKYLINQTLSREEYREELLKLKENKII